MKNILAVLLAILFATTGFSQISVQSVYPEHVLGELDCKPEVEGEFTYVNKQWSFSPPKISSKQLPDGSLVFTGPPGKYTIRCKLIVGEKTEAGILIKDPERQIREYVTDVTIMGDSKPEPIDDDEEEKEPEPIDDGEDEAPPTVVESAWVILIEETEDRSKHIDWLLIQQNQSLWQGINNRGYKWRWYDDDSADAAKYLKDSDKVGLPALLIYDKSGNLLGQKNAAEIKTADEFNAFIKKATGK